MRPVDHVRATFNRAIHACQVAAGGPLQPPYTRDDFHSAYYSLPRIALEFEGYIAARSAREDVLREAARAVCPACRAGRAFLPDGLRHAGTGGVAGTAGRYHCRANPIRALLGEVAL